MRALSHKAGTLIGHSSPSSNQSASFDAVAAVKSATDIVQLLGEYIRLEPFGNKFRALCPFHDDRRPSFQVDPEFQNYRCWACPAKGDVFTFLQEYEKISFSEALERLANRAGIALRSGDTQRVSRKSELLRVLEWASKEFQSALFDEALGSAARLYMRERRIEVQTAQRHAIGFAPPEFDWLIKRAEKAGFATALLVSSGLAKLSQKMTHYDAFRGRLIFPIRDPQGRVIAFGGRQIPSLDDGRSPKYLNSPATDVYNKSRVLYGLDVMVDALRKRTVGQELDPPVVMEGYLDCLMAYQAGLGTAVATCGTALTLEHVSRLRSYGERVVLMFDGDAAGQKATREATALFLQSEVDLRICILPDGLDPCDFIVQRGVGELRELIRNAPDAMDHAILAAKRAYDSSGIAGRSRAVEEVLETLSAMPAVLRGAAQHRVDLALNRLAESFGVSETTLRSRLRELRGGSGGPKAGPPAATTDKVEPMPARERGLAELLVVRPGRVVGRLRTWIGPDWFGHGDLRLVAENCFAIHDQLGEEASTEMLRQRLDDPRLDALVVAMADTSPKGEDFDRALDDVCTALESQRKIQDLSGSVRLAPDAGADEHLATLRELSRRNAL